MLRSYLAVFGNTGYRRQNHRHKCSSPLAHNILIGWIEFGYDNAHINKK